MGEVIGVSWLLGERRREDKATSSVVVYLQNEVFFFGGLYAYVGEEALCGRGPMEGLDLILVLILWGGVDIPENHMRVLLYQTSGED